VPPYAGPPAARPGDVAGVLRLLAYLILATALMVLDYRSGWLRAARTQAEVAVQPLWWLAGLPSKVGTGLREEAVTRSQLARDNERLRNALLIQAARNARLRTAAAENERLRGLLGSAERGRLDVQLASIRDIDLDPTRQRLLLDAGSNGGVQVGQAVIDAYGLFGQIIEVSRFSSRVLLVTDSMHALPAQVVRNGVRVTAIWVVGDPLKQTTNHPDAQCAEPRACRAPVRLTSCPGSSRPRWTRRRPRGRGSGRPW